MTGQQELGWCRSCARPVMWIEQPSGKRPPFDVDEHGAVVMENGRPRSHFATCPQAPAWRGKARA